jgi:hypothetical protein
MLRLGAWLPLSGLKLAATNVLFPHRSPADHSWCAETETWVIVAAKNRACRSGLRISKSVMKMLCPRDRAASSSRSGGSLESKTSRGMLSASHRFNASAAKIQISATCLSEETL